jgi:hypothetical protein
VCVLYCIPPQEIFRSKDLKQWESGTGMGSTTSIGAPLLKPNATVDQAVAPAAASVGEAADGSGPSKGWITQQMAALLTKLGFFFSQSADVNTSDMDLCEFRNQTVMYFNWGEQHNDNGLAVAVADMPMKDFLQGFFA